MASLLKNAKRPGTMLLRAWKDTENSKDQPREEEGDNQMSYKCQE